jgi:hypothetical protein
VTSVTATKSAVVVSGSLIPGGDLAGASLSLYALDPSQDDSACPSLTPAARQAAPADGDRSGRPRRATATERTASASGRRCRPAPG